MNLFWFELKRIFKTKLSASLLIISILFSAFMAYVPSTFPVTWIKDEAGNQTRLRGLDAINYLRKLNDDFYGEVTPQKVSNAISTVLEVCTEYGFEWDEVFYEKIQPNQIYIRGVKELQANRETGNAPSVDALNVTKILDYYDEMEGRLISVIDLEQKNHKFFKSAGQSAKKVALEKFSRVSRPYYYYYGVNTNSFDYEGLLILFLLIIFIVISATAFSTDEQSGAADIQRCTKNGMLRLALARSLAILSVCVVTYILCLAIFIVITNSLFGWESTKTSVQMLYSITSLIPWNVGQLQFRLAAYSLLIMFATICFTLAISALLNTNMSSLAIGLLAAISPMLLYSIVNSRTFANLLQCLMPSGGIGLGNGILYELAEYNFMNIGKSAFWIPDAMLVCTAIEVGLFFMLILVSYCSKHKKIFN